MYIFLVSTLSRVSFLLLYIISILNIVAILSLVLGLALAMFQATRPALQLIISKVTLKVINQDRMFFAEFSVNC